MAQQKHIMIIMLKMIINIMWSENNE